MLEFDPVSRRELEAAIEAKLARGGRFAVREQTVRGIHYPRVFVESERSLGDYFRSCCAEFADREFLVHADTRLSYDAAWSQARRLAHTLAERHGVGPGTHVAIAMRNSASWVVAFMAICAAGATAVPLNAWWQTGELEYALRDTGTRIVICDPRRLERLAPLKESLQLLLIGADGAQAQADVSLDALIEAAPSRAADAFPVAGVDPDANFGVIYTSGSTGEPKGVMLTHRGALSSILSWSFTMELMVELRPELASIAPPQARILTPLPLFHVTALHACMLLAPAGGRAVVLMDRWDANHAVEIVRRERITHVTGVPTMTHELIKAAGPGDLDTVVQIGTGGAKRPEQHVGEQYAAFPHTAPAGGWGMTETNALGAQIGMRDYLERPGSTGRVTPPVSQIQVRAEDGTVMPPGELGEIMMKSPGNFAGYLNKPAATNAALTPDGWLHTGDQGRFDDDGYLYIVGRIKEIVIRGGENISCLEVENAIYRCEGIEEVSAFSVPDERLGEVVGVAIYPTPGHGLDLRALRERLLTQLASFKVPEHFWVVDKPLPRGGTDKLDKRVARSMALARTPDFSV